MNINGHIASNPTPCQIPNCSIEPWLACYYGALLSVLGSYHLCSCKQLWCGVGRRQQWHNKAWLRPAAPADIDAAHQSDSDLARHRLDFCQFGSHTCDVDTTAYVMLCPCPLLYTPIAGALHNSCIILHLAMVILTTHWYSIQCSYYDMRTWFFLQKTRLLVLESFSVTLHYNII